MNISGKNKRSGMLSQSRVLAFLTVSLWSSAYVFTHTALEYYSPASLALLRCAVASVCLWAGMRLKRVPLPGLSAFPLFMLTGACGFALYTLAFNKGSLSLNPTTSCVLISTSPIITALLSKFVFGEKPGLGGWMAMALAFGGIVIMTRWQGDFVPSPGMSWILLAAVLISVYNVLQRWSTRRFSAMQVTGCSFFAGTLMLLPFLPETLTQLKHAPLPQLLLVCFLGAGPSALAYLLWSKALSLTPATSEVTNFMFLTPFLALVLEFLVTGDTPGAETFVGGSMIMVGLLLFMQREKAGKGRPGS